MSLLLPVSVNTVIQYLIPAGTLVLGVQDTRDMKREFMTKG